MPRDVESENFLLEGEALVVVPLGDRRHVGQPGGCRCGRDEVEERGLPFRAIALLALPALHRRVERGQELRTRHADPVERARLDQALHDTPVDEAKVDARA